MLGSLCTFRLPCFNVYARFQRIDHSRGAPFLTEFTISSNIIPVKFSLQISSPAGERNNFPTASSSLSSKSMIHSEAKFSIASRPPFTCDLCELNECGGFHQRRNISESSELVIKAVRAYRIFGCFVHAGSPQLNASRNIGWLIPRVSITNKTASILPGNSCGSRFSHS